MYFSPNPNISMVQEEDYPVQIEQIEQTFARYSHKGMLPGFDGLPLAYEYILAESAKASIVFLHGYTEFYQKFYELAWYLLNQGYNIFLYDLRGHGKSGREVSNESLSHVNAFEDYVKDLDCIITQLVKQQAPGLPIYLYSHSMGGAIAAYYLATPDCAVSKAVLSSPMIRPCTHHVPACIVKCYAARCAKKNGWDAGFPKAPAFNPNATVDTSNDASPARYAHFLDIRRGDTAYQNSTCTNRWMYESMCVEKHLLSPATTKAIHARTLILSAGLDQVVSNTSQKKFYRRLENTSFYCFPDSRHTIYTSNFKNRQQLLKLLISFYQ